MPKEEWGVKRVCPNCTTRFYDLQRDPMTCPACGNSFSAESLLPSKNRTLAGSKSASKVVADDLSDEDDVIDDDDSDVDLDDDVLDDDDEDVSLDDIADVSSDEDDN
ncbi:uncharacterized protein (TIGR02300 family) [Rhodovulum imhoffii]|uniref:Uncharacterized protein (TIGR02300 family) n=1 Tax=Rhodovulum imhoffii TaxID=365340 RepID=A0A2T5BRW0_9RHOB|nr:TIGR02300 family protein [Rhodovulum imhoffii]MBK5933278.1 TIGR02300 family protein [Rhodovulum imhoffii]PTN02013.1 uncharacterized protein (TIGR02300 family) [Rhodovulum imhoffii]